MSAFGQTPVERCSSGLNDGESKLTSRGVRALEGLRAPTQQRGPWSHRGLGGHTKSSGQRTEPLGSRRPGRARPRWAAVATWRRAPSTDPRRDGPPPGRLPPRPLMDGSQAPPHLAGRSGLGARIPRASPRLPAAP